MVNFKVGDAVKRVRGCGISAGLPAGKVGIVSVLRGTGFVEIEGYGGWLHNTENLELVTWDDELPPAPESVRYNDEYPDRTAYEQTWLDVKRRTHRIYLESGQYGTSRGVGMEISPEAALQLAHDLNRMAMEIKRKEKQG